MDALLSAAAARAVELGHKGYVKYSLSSVIGYEQREVGRVFESE